MSETKYAVELECVEKSFPRHGGWRSVFSESEALARLFGLTKRCSVLRGVSFRAPVGVTLGLVGMNGAGKTTVLRLLTTLLKPEKGDVRLHGVSLITNPSFARGVISKVSRDEAYSAFTPMENIRIAAGLYGVDREAACVAATILFKAMGLTDGSVKKEEDEINQKRTGHLSTGGQVKVALVRALLPLLADKEPDAPPGVLLLDEATSNLDVLAAESFFEALRVVRLRLPNLTVIMATNSVGEAYRCDQIVGILDGKIIEDPGLVARLRQKLEGSAEAARELAQFIDPKGAAAAATGTEINLPAIAAVPVTPVKTLTERDSLDRKRNRVVNIAIVLNFAVPILVGMYIYAATRPPFAAFVAAVTGMLFTLLAREGFRVIDRERSPYKMIETVLLSPMTTRQHLRAALFVGLKAELRTVTVFALVVFLASLTYSNIARQAWMCVSAMEVTDWVGVLGTFIFLCVSAMALGFCFVHAAFLMPSHYSFLVLQILPHLLILCGGIYYSPDALPWGLSHLAQINPVTYASQAMMEFLHLRPVLKAEPASLPAVDFLQSLLPGLPRGYACLILLCGLGALFAGLGSWLYGKLEPLVRKSGRYFS